MKTYPIQIISMKDLLRLQACVWANGLHGEIRQNNYVSNVRSWLYLALALPLEEATLSLKDCPASGEAEVLRLCRSKVQPQ